MSDYVTKTEVRQIVDQSINRAVRQDVQAIVDKAINKAVEDLSEVIGQLAQSVHNELLVIKRDVAVLKQDVAELKDSHYRLLNTPVYLRDLYEHTPAS